MPKMETFQWFQLRRQAEVCFSLNAEGHLEIFENTETVNQRAAQMDTLWEEYSRIASDIPGLGVRVRRWDKLTLAEAEQQNGLKNTYYMILNAEQRCEQQPLK